MGSVCGSVALAIGACYEVGSTRVCVCPLIRRVQHLTAGVLREGGVEETERDEKKIKDMKEKVKKSEERGTRKSEIGTVSNLGVGWGGMGRGRRGKNNPLKDCGG